MKKAFVTGWPIAHSKSPKLHGFWLDEMNLRGSYEAVAVRPEEFAAFLQEFPSNDFIGGNVTIPHKEMACELVPHCDELARFLGAANTLWLEDGRLFATNTDSYGFSANLDEHALEWREGETAVVLGAGGASRAVIHAVLDAGYTNVHIVNRTLSRAQSLADQFGKFCHAHEWKALPELLSEADFLVNTTSIGMEGSDSSGMPDVGLLPSRAIVTDIVYTPLQTPLLIAAQNHNLKTVDGLGMLLHQAVPGFEKWFGVRPMVSAELRNHILNVS